MIADLRSGRRRTVLPVSVKHADVSSLGMRAVLAVAGLLGASAVLGVAPGLPAASGATETREFRGPGIVLRYPSGLYLSTRPFDSVADPVQRFVLSTYRVPDGRPDSAGDYTPPANGVIVQLLEDVPAHDFRFKAPPRPASFTLPKLSGHVERFGDRWGEITFRDHGRGFYIFIAAGRRAPSSEIALVLHALDGLTVSPRPPSVTGA